MALSLAGYQPMGTSLDLLGAVPPSGNAKVVQRASVAGTTFTTASTAMPPTQAAIAARVVRAYGPRLQQLGFAPKPGEPAVDAVLRPT